MAFGFQKYANRQCLRTKNSPIACFGEDTAHNLYIVDLGGHIYAVLPN